MGYIFAIALWLFRPLLTTTTRVLIYLQLDAAATAASIHQQA
jgi:hypothetical protein